MTGMSMKRIREISAEVKAEHKKKKKQEKINAEKIIIGIIITIICGIVGFFLISLIVAISGYNLENQRKAIWINARKEYDRLTSAVIYGRLDEVKQLIEEENIPVELKGYEYNTALMFAVMKTHIDIIQYLLEAGADVLKKDQEGRSIMDLAEETNNLKVKKIISTALIDTTPEGSPIRKLMAAGYYYSEKSFLSRLDKRDIEALTLFLEADKDPYTHAYEVKGFHKAVEADDPEITMLMAERGDDIDTEQKNLALLTAAMEGFITIINYLLSAGTDINFKYENSHHASVRDYTPLIGALAEESTAVEHLLQKGANRIRLVMNMICCR